MSESHHTGNTPIAQRLTLPELAESGVDWTAWRADGSAPLKRKTRKPLAHQRVAFIIVNVETKQSTRYWSLLKETPGLDNIGDVSFLRHD